MGLRTMKKLKILELCHFSAGGCGVWARAKQESIELAKNGHEVLIISSNIEKGSNKIVSCEENLGSIKIQRYPAVKLGGESFMSWFDKKAAQKALEFRPDIIITHNYRHLHTTKALKLAAILRKQGHKCKVFLVTHAPFVEGNITTTKLQTAIVKFYDSFIGPFTLNKFDKILAISHWEIPYLLKAGAKKEKIVYLPNGIPQEFFSQKKVKEQNKILFLGRIAPKKKIETLISTIPHLEDKTLKIEIVGPKEEEYFARINSLITRLNVRDRVIISPPIYDIKRKIAKIDSCKVYVLASRVEGMPQSLIEAMARGKIVIGSNSIAIRDLIKDRENGYLFEFDDPKDLAKAINMALEPTRKNKALRKNAVKFVQQFRWDNVLNKLEKLFA